MKKERKPQKHHMVLRPARWLCEGLTLPIVLPFFKTIRERLQTQVVAVRYGDIEDIVQPVIVAENPAISPTEVARIVRGIANFLVANELLRVVGSAGKRDPLFVLGDMADHAEKLARQRLKNQEAQDRYRRTRKRKTDTDQNLMADDTILPCNSRKNKKPPGDSRGSFFSD